MVPRLVDGKQVAEFVEVGLGKTIGNLTALVDLGMPKTLVLAPPRVAKRVWHDEAAMWEHTKDVRVNFLGGTPAQRSIRLQHRADIDTISYGNFPWLCEQVDLVKRYGAIVFDELDKLKTPGSTGFKRVRTRTGAIPIRFGLTGTPVGNHYGNLWGEMYAVAGEKPLGPSKVLYMMQYFTAYEIDEHVKGWSLNYGAADLIHERIKPWAFSLDTTDIPRTSEMKFNPIHVELPKSARDLADELGRELRVWLKSGAELIALSSSARSSKVRQMAGGAVYYSDGVTWEHIHDEKLDALEELLEEAQGEPMLCLYWYKHERERILKRFPQACDFTDRNFERWKKREIELMLLHPASAGHGIDGLQQGGHTLVWYTLPWSWIFFSQAGGRLLRTGQLNPFVMAHVLLAGDADLAVFEYLHELKQAQANTMKAVQL